MPNLSEGNDMIITMSGANTFMQSQALQQYIADFLEQNDAIGLERLQADEKSYDQLLDSVQAMPFLSPKRLVIIYSPSSNKELNEKIGPFLHAVNDQADIVFVEPKFDKRSSLYKTLKKSTDYREFNELDESGLVRWLVDYTKSEQAILSASDARYLVQRIGLDQQRLSNEVQKLLSYRPSIDKSSIDLLTTQHPTSTIFDLLDAALRGEQRKALSLYDQQRKQKVEPQAILALLAWQLHVLATVKAAGPRSPEVIAKDAKLNPFVVRKSLTLARSLSVADIKSLVRQTLDLDIRLKSQSVDADESLLTLLSSLNR